MKKILLGICIAAMLLTIPSIYSRVMTEEPNKTVETAMPYATIHEWLVKQPDLTVEEVHATLKDTGITTVAVAPDSLETLQQRGMLTVISVSRMKELLIFNQLPTLEHPFDKDGIFIHSDVDASFSDITRNVFPDAQQIQIQNTTYTFVPGKPDELMTMPIGFDTEKIEEILEAGFQVIPRIGDNKNVEVTERLVGELMELKQDGIQTVIFNGNEVPFSTESEKLREFGVALEEAGYSIGLIEFNDQKGFTTLAYLNDLNVVRLHSQQVSPDTLVNNVEVFIRAFKERNIRIAFINLGEMEYEDGKRTLESFHSRFEQSLPKVFTVGIAEPFEKIELPLWQKLVGLIGLIAFLGFAAEVVFKRRMLTYVSIVGLMLLAIVYVITGMGIILKALALGLAIAAPIAAVLLPKDSNKKGYLLKSYAASIATLLLGVWFVVVLLNGNAFISGIDHFKGVTLVYALPIAFLLLYTIWENIGKLLKMSVLYWHFVVIAIIGLITLFYLGRTGNSGLVIPYELQFRMFLEERLYVRPRTKEFLIGLPLLVLAFHVAKTHLKTSYYLLIPAVIGVLSIMNTFTHFHIPLSISTLRTGYSVVLGFVIGLLFIALYELLKKWLEKEWARKRWVR